MVNIFIYRDGVFFKMKRVVSRFYFLYLSFREKSKKKRHSYFKKRKLSLSRAFITIIK